MNKTKNPKKKSLQLPFKYSVHDNSKFQTFLYGIVFIENRMQDLDVILYVLPLLAIYYFTHMHMYDALFEKAMQSE